MYKNKIDWPQVELVLESIVGRTVEQSMTEVVQEEEVLRAR